MPVVYPDCRTTQTIQNLGGHSSSASAPSGWRSRTALRCRSVFWDAFPDGRLEPSRLLAEGSVVAAEGRFIGTHTGVMRTPAGDVAATGRQVRFRWMSSYEVRGDELASEHLYFDQADLLGQLGLMPAT